MRFPTSHVSLTCNDADPLNVTLGNAGLRNPRTHIFELGQGNSAEKPDVAFSAWPTSISTKTTGPWAITYNRNTGARVFKPYSVNGNSIFHPGLDYATPLDKHKLLTLDTKTRFSATRSVDLMSVVTTDDYAMATMPDRSIVHNSYVSEDLKLNINSRGCVWASMVTYSSTAPPATAKASRPSVCGTSTTVPPPRLPCPGRSSLHRPVHLQPPRL